MPEFCQVTICSSGCWLCVSLGWRNGSPLLKFRGFINDSRDYFGGRGTAHHPLPHSFCVYIIAVAVYVGGERIAHCLPPHNVGMCLGGGGTGPPPHNVGLYFGGGTGFLPRNVGEYMQLVLRSQFRSLGALFLPPTAKSWKKRGMHCECKTCWWRGVPGSVSSMSASRGLSALRMRMLTEPFSQVSTTPNTFPSMFPSA